MTTTSQLNKSNTFQEDPDMLQKQLTVPEPFNLTKTRPKMIPLPKVIKRDIVAMPMPKDRKSLADIENDKKMRRQATTDAIRREYEDNGKQRFPLATEGLPSTKIFDKVSKEVDQRIQDP